MMDATRITDIRPQQNLASATAIGAAVRRSYAEAHVAKKEGRLVAWVTGGTPVELLAALNVTTILPESYAALCAAKRLSSGYCGHAEALGYSSDLCGYALSNLGLVLSGQLQDAPLGGLARPDFLVVNRIACDTHLKWFQVIARHFQCPIVLLEAGYNTEAVDYWNVPQHKLDFYIGQLRVLIQFVEERTGQQLTPERLRHTVELAKEAGELWKEIMNYRKVRPTPITGADANGILYPMVNLLGRPAAVSLLRAVRDEIRERAEHGKAAIPEEKIRLMYLNIPMWYALGLFNYVEKFGAVFVAENYNTDWPSTIVDVAAPLESLARKATLYRANCTLRFWRETILDQVVDYGVDGVIQLGNMGCPYNRVPQLEIQRVLRERLGIPSLIIDGCQADDRKFSESHVRAAVDTFLEMILRNRESRKHLSSGHQSA